MCKKYFLIQEYMQTPTSLPFLGDQKINYTYNFTPTTYNLEGCKKMLGGITQNDLSSLPDGFKKKWLELYELAVEYLEDSEPDNDEEE